MLFRASTESQFCPSTGLCGEFSNGFDLVLSVRRIWPLLTVILEELQELNALETL